MNKWNIGWGTVSACNMNCQFCYSRHKRKDSHDLGYEDWIHFIDENHAWINTINYGTGENTLNPHWFRLVDYIRKNYPDIRQALTTNGYLSEAVADGFCKNAFINAIDEIDVSLDYCDREKHTEFRGQPKAYEWAMNTLELCRQYHKPATIVFLGSRKNLNRDNIDGLFAIAKKYNAILRMNMYRPTEGIDEISERFIADYNTIIDIIKYISEHYQILSLNDALFSTILTGKTIGDPSGDKSIRILADGSITPSTYLIDAKYIVGNIQEKNVLSKLENEKSLEHIISEKIPEDCRECVYRETCAGGVYDRRYLWYGDLNHKDPYCPQSFKAKNDAVIPIRKTDFHSVHDGYLPTMFFRPI
ncbi:MAG: radical SAM protein [Roseburia sp.]|nr:radical SAM protein [Roseburia sp.]MCM1202086.1 radical SAM protein [Bacteroides fragilis]